VRAVLLAVWLLDVHVWFSWVVVVANGVVGVWALAAHWVEGLRLRALWWATAVAQVTIFVQAGLGTAVVAGEEIEAPEMHMFYGFVAIITVGIIYSYRQQLSEHRFLLYGFGGLFLMGLGLRAMVLGEPA
jgi:hypothetical protein